MHCCSRSWGGTERCSKYKLNVSGAGAHTISHYGPRCVAWSGESGSDGDCLRDCGRRGRSRRLKRCDSSFGFVKEHFVVDEVVS